MFSPSHWLARLTRVVFSIPPGWEDTRIEPATGSAYYFLYSVISPFHGLVLWLRESDVVLGIWGFQGSCSCCCLGYLYKGRLRLCHIPPLSRVMPAVISSSPNHLSLSRLCISHLAWLLSGLLVRQGGFVLAAFTLWTEVQHSGPSPDGVGLMSECQFISTTRKVSIF